MFRPLAVFVGLRQALATRAGGGRIVTRAAVGGLVVGITVLVVVLSVVNGFERELRERVLALLPHITLLGADADADWQARAERVRAVDGVTGVMPFARMPILVAAGGTFAGAQLVGIDVDRFAEVSTLPGLLEPGALGRLGDERFGLWMGTVLARRLGVEAGDSVVLVQSAASVTAAGVFARQKRFKVLAVFDSGAEMDGQAIYAVRADVMRLRRQPAGAADGLQVRTRSLFEAPDVLARIQQQVPDRDLTGSDWRRTHGALYRAIGTQKAILFVLLSMLVAVAAFNVVSALTMTVLDRRREIAILQTLGASPARVMAIFMVHGALIGTLGVVLGVVLGVAIATALPVAVGWLDAVRAEPLLNQYFVRTLPSQVASRDLAAVAGVGFVLCVLAAVHPAWRAARIAAAEVLRHE